MANENTGQEESADVSQGISQDEPGTGQEPKTESPAVDLTDSIVKAAIKAGESAASEKPAGEPTGEPAGDDEKPAPYDKDPKWLAARAAEKSLQEILSDNDIEDVEELKTMLKSGLTIKEIVGDRDAKQLIQDADTLKKYNAYWAEQERLKEDEDLDPDERAEKYKSELEGFKREQSDKQADKANIEAGKQAIENYNSRIESVVDKSLDGDAAEMGKRYLGVNNPFNNVDISDPKAVKAMATEGIAKFSTFLEKVRQAAIDEYAAGKSKIIPITSTDAPEGSPSTTKKELPKDASVEQVFSAAKNELFELLEGGTSP